MTRLGSLVVIGLFIAANGVAQEPGALEADFVKLHSQLTSVKESWQSIPWHLSVLEARTQAAKENKPIYMLCRAGHPLGCV